MSHETRAGQTPFLKWLTFAFGGAASALVAIPFVGYLFGALREHKVEWVKLGPASAFALNETRLETFENPLGTPWDGMAARMGVYVRNLGEEQVLGLRDELCAPRLPGHLVPAIRPVHVPVPRRCLLRRRPASLRPADAWVCSSASGGSGTADSEIQSPHLPTLQHTLDEPAKA